MESNYGEEIPVVFINGRKVFKHELRHRSWRGISPTWNRQLGSRSLDSAADDLATPVREPGRSSKFPAALRPAETCSRMYLNSSSTSA